MNDLKRSNDLNEKKKIKITTVYFLNLKLLHKTLKFSSYCLLLLPTPAVCFKFIYNEDMFNISYGNKKKHDTSIELNNPSKFSLIINILILFWMHNVPKEIVCQILISMSFTQ